MIDRVFAIGIVAVGLIFSTHGIAAAGPCDAVKKEMAYGQAAVEDAKDQAGFKRAATEFQKAADKAPTCAAAFFNLGVVQEKAGNLNAAKSAYERYLKLSPKAADAGTVEQQVFKLEYRIKQKTVKKQKDRNIKSALQSGKWCLKRDYKNFGTRCAVRRYNSGVGIVKITVTGDNFLMIVDWQNGSFFTYRGTIRDRQIKGRYSTGHSQEPSLNCSNFDNFTAHLHASGKELVISNRLVQRMEHCRITQSGNEKRTVYVKIY